MARLAGFTGLSLKISSQDSRCIVMAGNLFTACPIDQHSRVLLLSIFQIVFIKFWDGHLAPWRSFLASTALYGMATDVVWNHWRDCRISTLSFTHGRRFHCLFTALCQQLASYQGSLLCLRYWKKKTFPLPATFKGLVNFQSIEYSVQHH